MPAFDMSDVLLDPDFLDTFVVRRRVETVGNNGRSVVTNSDTSTFGVVTAGSDNKLERQSDQQHAGKSLSIVTIYPVRGPAPGYQPDLIFWGRDWFVVDKLEDYSHYGPGFVQVECSSIDSTDEPPGPMGGGILDFSDPDDSGLIGH